MPKALQRIDIIKLMCVYVFCLYFQYPWIKINETKLKFNMVSILNVGDWDGGGLYLFLRFVLSIGFDSMLRC